MRFLQNYLRSFRESAKQFSDRAGVGYIIVNRRSFFVVRKAKGITMMRSAGKSDKQGHYESLRLQMSKLSEVVDIGERFSQAVSPNHLLSLIVKRTLDLMGVEICIIWLSDKAGSLIPRMSFGLTTTIPESLKIELGSEIMKSILKEDKPTFIYDLKKKKESSMRKLIELEGLKSLLASPLLVGDEKLGVLMVCAKKSRRFTDVEMKVFDALAKQSALAIMDIGLYDSMDRRMKEKAKEMSMLFTMSRSLSTSIDLDLLLTVILEKAKILMKAEFCVLKLLDNSRRKLELAAAVGIDKAHITALSAFDDELAMKDLHMRVPYVINNIASYGAKKAPRFLKKNNINSLIVVPLFSHKRRIGVLSAYVRDMRIFENDDIEMFEMVSSLCSLAIDNTTMLERVRRDYLNTIKTLARIIDANDPYTCGHCEKVMKYSLAICRKLGLSPANMSAIKTASLLHDIGKIGIDLSIIRKTDALTDDDWRKIKMHPDIGAKIVSQVGFLNDIVPIIKHHHERFAGGGYPDANKRGNNIPIGARVISVADAFDAMTSDRPYRRAMAKEKAIEELKRCSGSQFDPEVVTAFLRVAN